MKRATLDRPMEPTPVTAGVKAMKAMVKGDRRTAALVGALFLVATTTFFVSDALITPLLEAPDFVAQVGEEATLVVVSALLALVCGVAVVGIAALLFPLLKRDNEPVALAYLGVRSAELVVIAV